MVIEIVTKNLLSGGAERVIYNLVNYWSSKGIICKIILVDKREIFYKFSKNVEVIEIGKMSNNPIIDKFLRYKKVRDLTKSIGPDIVLSLPEEIGIYTIGALLFSSFPVVVSERNDPWRMPYKKSTRLLRKLLYPFADGLIFQTKEASMFFSSRLREKGAVLKNPFDSSIINEIDNNNIDNNKDNIIIGAGRLEKQKNFALLIEAFELFSREYPDFKLHIYGNGSLKRDLENLAKEKNIGDKVILPGSVKNLSKRIANARVFVLSSDYEGVPNVLIEAMAIGTPCIATNCSPGGAASLISNGENGFLIACGDKIAMYNKMKLIVDNECLSNDISRKSVLIKEELAVNKVGEEWLSYLKHIISRHNMK